MSVRLLQGHSLDVLRTSPEASAHCCVTSPPYFGLRSYGTEPQVWDVPDKGCVHHWGATIPMKSNSGSLNGSTLDGAKPGIERRPVWESSFCQSCHAWRGSLGNEPTVDLYVSHLVQIFREVKRVLRDDGTLWLNLGSSYAGSWGNQGRKPERGTQRPINGPMMQPVDDDRYPTHGHHTGALPPGLKPKDLIPIPWLVGLALQRDGWWLRADCVWHKPNGMPASVTDRPTITHEYVLLLAKSEDYFYDATAVAEPAVGYSHHDLTGVGYQAPGQTPQTGNRKALHSLTYSRHRSSVPGGQDLRAEPTATRNKRSVWTIPTSPYAEAHFATMPPALVEPCIKAGTSERGCCAQCLSPWQRMTASAPAVPDLSQRSTAHYNTAERYGANNGGNGGFDALAKRMREGTHGIQTIGWEPTCACGAPDAPVPCTVLDPFGGSGTTGLVADRLGRDAILIELSPTYVAMAERRLYGDAPLLMDVETA